MELLPSLLVLVLLLFLCLLPCLSLELEALLILLAFFARGEPWRKQLLPNSLWFPFFLSKAGLVSLEALLLAGLLRSFDSA